MNLLQRIRFKWASIFGVRVPLETAQYCYFLLNGEKPPISRDDGVSLRHRETLWDRCERPFMHSSQVTLHEQATSARRRALYYDHSGRFGGPKTKRYVSAEELESTLLKEPTISVDDAVLLIGGAQ